MHYHSGPPPRFSKLLNSVLGSPFLTTSDLPSVYDDGPMESEESESDVETIDGAFATVPRQHTVTRPPSPSPSFRTETYSIVNWNMEDNAGIYSMDGRPSLSDDAPRCFRPAQSQFTFPMPGSSYYPYPSTPYNSLRFSSFNSVRSNRSFGSLTRIWDALRESSPHRKGKRRFDAACASIWNDIEGDGYIDYANLPPLDGEEFELIDDEACFIDVRAVTGVDIVGHLPDEVALQILSYLDFLDIISCLGVSRTWRRLAQDNPLWRHLFSRRKADGWLLDMRRQPSRTLIDWQHLYRSRAELDRRWCGLPSIGSGGGDLEDKENIAAFQPRVRRLSGHNDSVYCLEFDSTRIITGSRDRTIKVWSIQSGRCLSTFTGHDGSVLCLKFDKDWDLDDRNTVRDLPGSYHNEVWRRGFMVSGSSDCSICVWDLYAMARTESDGNEDEGGEVIAQVRDILTGHTGGVLDIRIDANWIVSCSKDCQIRVWNRHTLELHCVFRGHEGPVNAVGLEGNRVVSASGDGKMMLWDIPSRERIRIFEGHDRGLACIEFKDDIIVSGSNDCKIKVWSVTTGECIRTLAGHDFLVRALSFDTRSGRLVSGSYDKTVKIWDLKTGKMLREFKACHVSHIFDVKFDGRRVMSTSHDQKIAILDFSEGLEAALFV
ncbi:WD40-repeat-containing domain protein [Abortiporus biennis]|nr:WD40-repeat-containing domain protein [Abortiporus biennis]